MKKIFGYVLLIFISLLLFSNNLNYDSFPSEKDYISRNSKETRINLVFYKKGCRYCEASRDEIIEEAKNSNIVTYFIDTETREGITIARKYHVEYAPTMVVIRNNDYRSFLYTHDKGRKIVVETNKIKEAFRK
ncbi:hypothetical protein BOVMAS03_16640 [Streptococcus uberis]|uniref:thioredoxin n=2 Tax=Streptococcus uberis TaxID=1349 RepID=UPI002FEC0183